MGGCKLVTVITAASFVALAVHLYSTVPEGLAEPGLTRTYIAAFKFANIIAFTVEMVTRMSAVSVIRYQIETLYRPVFSNNPELLMSDFFPLPRKVEDLRFDGIPVRMYKPRSLLSGSLAPCIVYFHGGGWSLFSTDSYDLVTSQLSLETKAIVVSVNFRQAPENPYPIPFDDCVKATRHILHNFKTYGIDGSRVAVAGDGSGANLAAAVALRLSEEDPEHTPPLKLQVLIQPALQAFSFDTPSYRQNAAHALVTRSQMIIFWCQYFGIEPSSEVLASFKESKHISPSIRKSVYSTYFKENRLPGYVKKNYVESSLDQFSFDHHKDISQIVEPKVVDQFISPLLAENLAQLCQTYILVAEYDVLRDDGLYYAARLLEANVSVTVGYVENQTQGFLTPMADFHILRFFASVKVWHEIYMIIKMSL